MLITIALLSAVVPFGAELYLAAFPAMMSDLSTTTTGVQLSLTAFFVGAGVGQLAFGPWSDRAGRMLPLLAGLALFLAASVAATLAWSIEMLIVARLLQGIGASAGMVLGRAMVIDRAEGAAAARALSIVFMIGGVAPIIAPLVGSTLADAVGWRGLLAGVGVIGVVALTATLLFLRETLPHDVRAARWASRRTGSWKALLARAYVGNVVAAGFSLAIMMAYIGASPFVYLQMIGLTPIGYGTAFAINALGLALAAGLASRLIRRLPLRVTAAIGLALCFAAIIIVLVLTVIDAPAQWLLIPLFFTIAPLGLVFGNVSALALSAVPLIAIGSASAFLGLLQFVLAGIATGLVGVAGEDSAVPMALTMFGAAVIASAGLAFGRHATITTRRSA